MKKIFFVLLALVLISNVSFGQDKKIRNIGRETLITVDANTQIPVIIDSSTSTGVKKVGRLMSANEMKRYSTTDVVTRIDSAATAIAAKLSTSVASSTYATKASVDTAKANIRSEMSNNINYVISNTDAVYAKKVDIGKDASTYFFVDRQWTGSRGGTSWTAQASVAKRASKTYTFADIWQARDSAIMAIRRGEIASAVVYILSGNSFSFAEDTCTRHNVDYKINSVSESKSVNYYANYESDSTSTQTSNLAFSNLTYIFEQNTYLKNYSSCNSIIVRSNYNGSGSARNLTNFKLLGSLNYESFYGQKEGRTSKEIFVERYSTGIKLEFNDFLSRRGYQNILFQSDDYEMIVNGKFRQRTNDWYLNQQPDSFSETRVNIRDFRSGSFADESYNVGDYWYGIRLEVVNNKNIYFNYDNLWIGYSDSHIAFTANDTLISNMNLYITAKSFKHEPNAVYPLGAFAAYRTNAQKRKFRLDINFDDVNTSLPLFTTYGMLDSANIIFNSKTALIQSKNTTNMSGNSVFELSGINSKSVIKITGNYVCNGFASMISVTGGSGTIILDGNFRTLDDKPVINVTSGFTGKLIINGVLVVGSQITTPSSACISGNGSAIIQAVISNKAATSTVTGGTISVNSNYKF